MVVRQALAQPKDMIESGASCVLKYAQRGQFISHAPLDLSIHDTCSHARPIAGQPPSMMDVTDWSSPDATLHNSIVGAAAASQHQLSATYPKTQGFDAHDSVV